MAEKLVGGSAENQKRAGDLTTIVEEDEGGSGQETGYSLEVFNAVGETIVVIIVEVYKIRPVNRNEILHQWK